MRYRTTFTVTVDYAVTLNPRALAKDAIGYLERALDGEALDARVSVDCRQEVQTPMWQEIPGKSWKRRCGKRSPGNPGRGA